MMFWGAHSDRTGERRRRTALPLLVIASGLVGVAFTGRSLPLTVALLSCVPVGYSSFKGPFWAFTSSALSPARIASPCCRSWPWPSQAVPLMGRLRATPKSGVVAAG